MKVDQLTKNQILNNSFWKLLESIGSSGIQLLITIILARLLTPHDYGIMAIVLVVITFLTLFVNSSISAYLVYSKDIKKQHFLTTLLLNILASTILMLIIGIGADPISVYYESPSLKPLIVAMAITLPFNAVAAVYNAYAMKFSYFRALFLRNMISLPISGGIAMVMAYYGFGVWALVAQQISSSILLAMIMVVTIRIDVEGEWRIEKNMISPMLKYGGFVLITTIIAFISDNISDLLIGKKISPKQLGYYNRGCYFPNSFTNIANGVLCGVLFPAFASYNSDISELKEKFRKTLRLLYYGMFPLFMGLIACSKPLIISLLTDKWAFSIPIMQIICLYFMIIPFLQTCSQVSLATGFVKLRMSGEIIKMICTLPLLFFFVNWGIAAVAWARVLVNVILICYSMYINRKIMDYKLVELLVDMKKPLLVGLLIFACTYPIIFLPFNDIVLLIAQIIIGVIVYLFCLKTLHIQEMEELVSLVLKKIRSKKNE